MKILNSKILTVILSAMAIFALSGCGSSGTSSSDELVGGTEGGPHVATPYEITAHHDSTVVVHSHVTPSPTGDEHTHAWTQVSGPTVALTTPTAQTTTFVMPSTTTTTQPVVLQHVVHNIDKGTRTSTQHTVMPISAAVTLTLVLNQHQSVVSGQKGSFHLNVSGGDGQYTYVVLQKSGPTVHLSNTHLSAPSFIAPAVSTPVDLVFDVIVTDGQGNTGAKIVTITVTPPAPANTAPVAVVHADNLHHKTGEVVKLDGSGSHDTDSHDPLTFAWILNAPGGSSASLSDASAVHPTFIPDVDGDYILQLIVNDGKADSAPVTVSVTATHVDTNAKPVAVAKSYSGLDVKTNTPVTLDGTGSTDADGDTLTYAWLWVSKPTGSKSYASPADSPVPTFTPDVDGDYILQLIVNDGKADSAPVTVTIKAAAPHVNSAPTVVIGQNQTVKVGEKVTIDASGTTDDGLIKDRLTYHWSLQEEPNGSTAKGEMGSQHTHISWTYIANEPGKYEWHLLVYDGEFYRHDYITVIAQ